MGRQLKYHVEVINQEKEQLSSILTSMTDAVITFNRDYTIITKQSTSRKIIAKMVFTNGQRMMNHNTP